MSKKVLVVDDSTMMRMVVKEAIEDLNDVETVEATNGYEAFKSLPQHSFDMIILDLNMPEINGWEVLRFVKSHQFYKHIPIIIISTDHKDADVRTGLALGANKYFTKPFEMEQLKETVSELLRV